MRETVLVEVETTAQYRALAAALATTTGIDIQVVPLRREDTLVSPLQQLAKIHQRSLRLVPLGDLPAGIESVASFARNGPPSSPALTVLPLSGVHADVVALARCFVDVVVISDISLVERSSLPQRMLILYDGSAIDEMRRTLSTLTMAGIPFGVVVADDSRAGRLSLLKTLLFTVADVSDIDRIESLDRWSTASDGVASTDDAHHRILLASGHGNAVDLGKGGQIICSRGQRDDLALRHAYPCHGDGQCFRQPLFKRSPRARKGLIDAAEIGHPIVLLLGCATLPLRNDPVAIAATIVGQLRHSHNLAGVATLGILYNTVQVETVLIGLLLDGHTLGDAVHAANEWHRDRYGSTSPARDGYGPLVAFGNPGLRVTSRLVHRLLVPDGSIEAAETPSTSVPLSPNGIAYLAFDDLPRGHLAARMLDPGAGMAGSAVQVSTIGRDDTQTYFGLTSIHSKKRRARVRVIKTRTRAFQEEIATLHDSLASLLFWRLYLKAASEFDQLDEAVRLARSERDEMESVLLRYLSTSPQDTLEVAPSHEAVAAHDSIMALWRRWQRHMLDAAVAQVTVRGTYTFHLWQDFYQRSRDGCHWLPCPTCGHDTVPISYRPLSQSTGVKNVLHCDGCGVLGELPDGLGVKVESVRQSGSRLVVRVCFHGQQSVRVEGLLALVRECWFQIQPDISQTVSFSLAPGELRSVPLSLAISANLPPGTYPLSLVGVMNGGLVHIRTYVSLT